MAAMDVDEQEELASGETEAVPKRTSSAVPVPVPVLVPVPVPSLRPHMHPRRARARATQTPISCRRPLTPALPPTDPLLHAHTPSSPPPGGRPVPIDDERDPGRLCSQLRLYR